jgi:uncharacterized protein (TIGR02145 family)
MLGLRFGIARFSLRKLFVKIPGEGLLYNKKTIKDEYGKNIAPPGWRIMTTDDFVGLIDYLGGEVTAPGKLKKTETWNEPENTNESGFSALPVGLRDDTGKFTGRNSKTQIWIDNR